MTMVRVTPKVLHLRIDGETVLDHMQLYGVPVYKAEKFDLSLSTTVDINMNSRLQNWLINSDGALPDETRRMVDHSPFDLLVVGLR